MKRLLKYAALLTLLAQEVVAAERPNILLVVLDDWGWRDAGFMGNAYIETPALDALANDGLVFQQAYSNAPNCAPSRAALMSGQYAPRTGVYTMMTGDMGDKRLRRVQTPPNPMHLETSVVTLAEMLKGAGYRTAHIGKWNLGSGEVRGPQGQGFDLNVGGDRSGNVQQGHFAPYGMPGLEKAPEGEYLTDRLTREAIHFLEQKSAQPFFIHLSHYAPHFPYQAPEALIRKYRDKSSSSQALNDPAYAAMVEQIDTGIQALVAALEKNQLLDNTLILVTSDNGGYENISWQANLRGQKSLLYEGGIRVPLLIYWKGHLQAGTSNTAVIGTDIYPTLMAAAGITHAPQALDGVDLTPMFQQPDHVLDRPLFWYFPAYVAGMSSDAPDIVFQQRPAAVIRRGPWKLIRYYDSDAHELYQLEQDPGEQNNRIQQEPELAQQLMQELEQWLRTVDAPLSLSANPDYDRAYENRLANSWWRQLRLRLSETRYGAFLREKDL